MMHHSTNVPWLAVFLLGFFFMTLATWSLAADGPQTAVAAGAGDATAPATQPTQEAAARGDRLRAGIASFVLRVWYFGPQDKPFYAITLHVGPMQILQNDPFHLYVRISEAEAKQIVAHLEGEGFLDAAIDQSHGVNHQAELVGPAYSMICSTESPAGRAEFFQTLGWDGTMLKRLDGLRGVLTGNAGKEMDLLLGRLSGQRKLWEPKATPRAE